MALLNPEELNVGSASEFRGTLNGNFQKMQDNAASINNEVNTLRTQLQTAKVGLSGLASDLTTDETHRTVTDAQKTLWGQKLTIQTEAEPSSTQYHIFQEGTDLTPQMQTLFSSGSWKPTKTSDLINDSGFISGSELVPSTSVYIEGVTVTKVEGGTPLDTGFTVQWVANCSDGTTKCTADMVPTAVLTQEDSMSGDWSQVCQSGDGVVYLWSKASTATHTVEAITLKALYAVLPVRIEV